MRSELVEVSPGKFVIDLGDGFTIPASGEFTVRPRQDFPFAVTIRYLWSEDRFNVTEVTVKARDGSTVTGEVLRKVPVERMLREHLSAIRKPRRRPSTAILDELLQVATIYGQAYVAHQPPVQAVAKQLNIPESTAAKKVMAARRAGLLRPTTPGKAGA
jgi:hypothetical protein